MLRYTNHFNKNIQVYDLNFNLVEEVNSNDKEVFLNISNYSKGTYFIRTKIDNKTNWGKFIKE